MVRQFSPLKFTFAIALAAVPAAAAPPQLVKTIVIPGEATDRYVGATGANFNRLGGPFSDLFYDRKAKVFYGLVDRGPGGGLISYETRVEKFQVNINSRTGAISNFRIQSTILFRTADGSQPFNGLNPGLLNNDRSVLGRSFDPEGITLGPKGELFVSDEYGPSLYQFKLVQVGRGQTQARFVKALTIPANLLPMEGTKLNFVDGRGTLTSGRQDNRGFEGLTITPNGKLLYGCLQDPLVTEGENNDGRRSRNVRLVAWDIATGQPRAQYIYQLESLEDINARVPGDENDFGATAQGRNIGLSAITALTGTEFLVLERDNRGRGVEDALGANPVASKRVYRINVKGATDVTNVSLVNTNDLPAGVTPVSKTLFIDIQEALVAKNQPIGEKFEGLAIGPKLSSGAYVILTGTDNDFSVTQTGEGAQSDVYTDGTSGPIDGPAGTRKLLPIYMLSFKGKVPGFVPFRRK